jgi:hypothetical protein
MSIQTKWVKTESRVQSKEQEGKGGAGKMAIFRPFFIIILSGVRLSPLSAAATNWPIVPTPDDR